MPLDLPALEALHEPKREPWAAAWAAAGAAAKARLAPTVAEMQASAVALVRRMCAAAEEDDHG